MQVSKRLIEKNRQIKSVESSRHMHNFLSQDVSQHQNWKNKHVLQKLLKKHFFTI